MFDKYTIFNLFAYGGVLYAYMKFEELMITAQFHRLDNILPF